MRLGGQSTPRGGDKTNRYTSVRPRIISVRANISAGQSSNSSGMEALAREDQTEAGVGSSLRKLSFSTSCSWWAIVASFPLLIPLSGGTSSGGTYCSRRVADPVDPVSSQGSLSAALGLHLARVGRQVPRRMVPTDHAITYRADEENCPLASSTPGTDPQLLPGGKAHLQWRGRGPEQQ